MTMILRLGDRSQDVQVLQQRLIKTGAKLEATGLFDAATEAAVRALQLKAGLVADGIAGEKTLAAMMGYDTSRRLKQATLVAGAKRLGVELAAVMAFNEVESKGSGFLDSGKPKILFERHIMYRQLCEVRKTGDDTEALKARAEQLAIQQPNLVNQKAGGYIGGSGEHQRLAAARQIDETSALESASWGAFQVMGYHAVRLGYADVQEFVERMSRDENEQFEAFVRFIAAEPALLKALQAKRWSVVAKLYNGADYLRNMYDTKLERAYERYAEAHVAEAA
ncbi:N-acetylmuramidase domain-containing protein [Pseudomonas sp. Marseille-Q5115]|uniref:N-acetylmuramidase domain-containing protein n=1 Tax=Pseudomonas sp. Marseille-Q5115 TaxID=2866593 RepID=UPI001CE3F5C3|nr:N-acetylmuramidase family protein [Pseudomonas sp. Marseille-Q5115]